MLLGNQYSANTLYLVIHPDHIAYATYVAGKWSKAATQAIPLPTDDQTSIQQLALSIQALTNALEQKISQSQLPVVRYFSVLVADTWIPSASIAWSAAANRNAQLKKLAAIQQIQFAGLQAEEHDTVKFIDVGYQKPSLVLAYPYQLMTSLLQLQAELDIELLSVLPISIASVSITNKDQATHNVLGVYTPGLLTVVDETNSLIQIKSRKVEQNSEHSVETSIRAEWIRIKLRASQLANVSGLPLLNLTSTNLTSSDDLNLIDSGQRLAGDYPSKEFYLALMANKRRSPVDAVPQSLRLSNVHWMVIVVLLTVMTVLATQVYKGSAQLAQIERNIEQASRQQTVVPEVETWSKEEVKQAKAINQAIQQLNLPFSDFLEALQPPQDIRVAIVNLDLNTAANSEASHIKMVAEAKTSGEMAQYISFLSQQTIFSEVFLVSHEKLEAAQNQPYRFNVQLQWKGR